MAAACPCGSGAPAERCCTPLLEGAPAPTALALMRSRYTAYVRGAIDYLVATHDPATRATLDRAAIESWSRKTEWLGLEIVKVARGGAEHDDGIVEFIARGQTRGAPFEHRECSRFRRRDGRWYYVEDVHVPRPAAAPGRNDRCPCGSGKKYKRCHGA